MAANDLIALTGDEHHVFLEGFTRLAEKVGDEDVTIYRLWMGS